MQLTLLLLTIVAALRITDALMLDRVCGPLRRLLPKLPWNCGRCVSVWGGIIALGLYLLEPLAVVPFAASYLYVALNNVAPAVAIELEGTDIRLASRLDAATIKQLLRRAIVVVQAQD